MDEGPEGGQRVKCPWCAEMIMPEALVCPFCRSKLTGNGNISVPAAKTDAARPEAPGMVRCMIQNLLCPGLAAWKLGHRARGAVIFCLITACFCVYAYEIIPIIQKEAPKIASSYMKSGRLPSLVTLEGELKNNPWLDIAFYLYLLSFVDVYFLVKNSTPTGSVGASK